MAIDQSEILALRVVLRDVRNVRRDIAGVKADVAALRAENTRAAASQANLGRQAAAAGATARRSYDQATQSARNLGNETRRTGNAFGSMRTAALGAVGAIGSVWAAVKTAFVAVERFESQRGFNRSLRFNLGAEAAGLVSGGVESFANRQGLAIGSVRGTAASLAGTGNVDPASIVPIIRAFTALGGAGGANTNQISRGFEQLAQIAAQGQLQGDELRSINENLIPLRRILIEGGLGPRLGSQTNPITWKEIEKALLRFGERAEVDKLLKEQAEQASASIQRLSNAINNDLLPPIGEALTPAVKELGGSLKEWVSNLKPEDIKRTTEQVIAFGKGVAAHTPEILGLIGGLKLYAFYANTRLAGSALNAAAALDVMAASARVGGAGGIGGGIAGGGGRTGLVGGILGGAARMAGAVGGAYLGGEVAGAFSDNPLVRLGGAVAGGFAGQAAIGGLGRLGAGLKNVKNGLSLASRLAGMGGGGAGGGITAGAIGTGAGAATLVGGAMLATISLVERASGVGADDSIFSNLMFGGQAGSIRNAQAAAATVDRSFLERWKLRRRFERLRRVYGDSVMLPHILAAYFTAEERQAINLGGSEPARSPRAAAYDSRAAETDSRSIRYSM